MPSNQGIELRSPALQADSLLSEPPGKTLMSWLQIKKNIVLKCHLLLFCATTSNHFLIAFWLAMKSGFYTTN